MAWCIIPDGLAAKSFVGLVKMLLDVLSFELGRVVGLRNCIGVREPTLADELFLGDVDAARHSDQDGFAWLSFTENAWQRPPPPSLATREEATFG